MASYQHYMSTTTTYFNDKAYQVYHGTMIKIFMEPCTGNLAYTRLVHATLLQVILFVLALAVVKVVVGVVGAPVHLLVLSLHLVSLVVPSLVLTPTLFI